MASPSKRRKTSSALFKPFKSPLKTPLKPASTPTNTISETPTAARIYKADYAASPLSTITNVPPTTSPTSKAAPPASPTSPSATSTTSLHALQTHHTRLASSLRSLHSQLDTHTQALKIESSAKDAELTRLIALWRAASRQAAEEIFAGVRDRVNRMGGVGAWWEREREGRERWGAWDDGGEKRAADGEEGAEEEGAEEKREREEGRGEDERAEEERRREEGGDDEGFTMDMMLKSLSIELDVIGYDKEMQRWIE